MNVGFCTFESTTLSPSRSQAQVCTPERALEYERSLNWTASGAAPLVVVASKSAWSPLAGT